jgi:hypothetical protein
LFWTISDGSGKFPLNCSLADEWNSEINAAEQAADIQWFNYTGAAEIAGTI